MHCIIPVEGGRESENTDQPRIGTYLHIWNRRQGPTRLVFLDGFVFKVSKHDLEPVGVVGSQHPETEEAEEILHALSALKTRKHEGEATR